MRLSTNVYLGLLFLCLAVGISNEVHAQSNFDLDPPMQADTNSEQVLSSSDPSALPVFKFATAEIKDGKVVVATTIAQQKLVAPVAGNKPVPPELDPRGIRRTEMVTQNYTVQIPYTETLADGTNVTKMRSETRTRSVPVSRYSKRNAEEQAAYEKALKAKKKEDAANGVEEKPATEMAKMEMVTRPYTINVPYTEIVDGKPTTRMRQETRTRTVQVMRGKTETKSKTVSSSYQFSDVAAYSVTGKKLEESAMKDRISDRAPVILVNSPKAISPYFEAILKPGTIFLVCPLE